jgi:molybdate transport system ATP-binding protein
LPHESAWVTTLDVAIRHRYGDVTIDIAFTAPAPGVVALFGPSGAGKSTVLSAVAGLLRADHGRVSLGAEILDPLPVERRGIGFVFQDALLFPHLSVAGNLRYGQRRARGGMIRFEDVVSLLGLGSLLDRRPRTLSGGERQRVAIGRALLSQPRLLLMDEPLASLDAPRRAEIISFLLRIKTEFAIPILYVTHALDEVLSIADTLVLLESGRVVAAGPLADIASRPDLAFARRDDAAAVVEARVAAHDPARRLTRLDAGTMILEVPLLEAPIGAAVRARIPAREVILASETPRDISIHNIILTTVTAISEDPQRHAAIVALDASPHSLGPHPLGTRLLARVTPDAVARLGLIPGKNVLALVKSMAIEVLPTA